MKKTLATLAIASLTLPFAIACASDGSSGTSTTAANGTTSRAPAASGSTAGGGAAASPATSAGTSTGATSAPSASTAGSNTATRAPSGAPSIPSLVNVDLRNVLNNLAVKLNIDRANVPVTAQLPIQLAANVCGVSVNVLSVSTGGQANCTAKTAPQELTQAVQQQMAAGGSVGGGAQSNTTGAAGAATGGAANTSATSSGQGAPATTTTPPK
jgi:hypothetical protein